MDKLRGIYGEIKGITFTLTETKSSPTDELVDHFNVLVDKVMEMIPDEDIERFKISPKSLIRLSGHSGHMWKYTDVVTKVTGLEGFLKYRFDMNPSTVSNQQSNSTPNVTIINHNTLAVTMNQTIQNIIEKSTNEEEKAKLSELDEELKKPAKDWNKVKTILAWVLNYSRDLSLQIMPIILKAFLTGSPS